MRKQHEWNGAFDAWPIVSSKLFMPMTSPGIAKRSRNALWFCPNESMHQNLWTRSLAFFRSAAESAGHVAGRSHGFTYAWPRCLGCLKISLALFESSSALGARAMPVRYRFSHAIRLLAGPRAYSQLEPTKWVDTLGLPSICPIGGRI